MFYLTPPMTKKHFILLDYLKENFDLEEEFIIIFNSTDEVILIDKNNDKMKFYTNNFGEVFFKFINE